MLKILTHTTTVQERKLSGGAASHMALSYCLMTWAVAEQWQIRNKLAFCSSYVPAAAIQNQAAVSLAAGGLVTAETSHSRRLWFACAITIYCILCPKELQL